MKEERRFRSFGEYAAYLSSSKKCTKKLKTHRVPVTKAKLSIKLPTLGSNSDYRSMINTIFYNLKENQFAVIETQPTLTSYLIMRCPYYMWHKQHFCKDRCEHIIAKLRFLHSAPTKKSSRLKFGLKPGFYSVKIGGKIHVALYYNKDFYVMTDYYSEIYDYLLSSKIVDLD